MTERADITQSLRKMGLVGENEQPHLIELSGGVSADIFLAETAEGPICVKKTLPVLKVAGDWKASPTRGEAEKKWIRLVESFLPAHVPKILGEDNSAFTFAMNYLDPKIYRNWKSLLRDGLIDSNTGTQVANILGAIHKRTAGDPLIARAFANDNDFFDLRLNPYLEAAGRANPDVADILHLLVERTASTKLALVHGDFSPKNILIGPEGPVILDAECAWYGDPAFDIAFCLNQLLLKCVWQPQHARAYLTCAWDFWNGYVAAVGLSDPATEMRVATLLPGLTLARLDGKSPVEYLTNSGVKEKVRRFAKRSLRQREATLAVIIDAWRGEFSK